MCSYLTGGPSVRDARLLELDDVALLIRDAYQQYRSSFSRGLWDRYLADIVDVRSRLDSADLIVAED